MSDIFISYARSTEDQARLVEQALEERGYSVWRDDELPAHRTYADVIEERLKSAKAVIVIWSAEAVKSQWVRAEADAARALGTLVQVSFDGTVPPMPFNQIHCADLAGWDGDASPPGWKKIEDSVAALVGAGGTERAASAGQRPRERSICVLPFANMSGDAEQEYFSDGISEDITTDLSKVSALSVAARNTAFQFKGKSVDVRDVARKVGVSHILEGSVRKCGGRVRISAQLIDGATGDHVWAERYDRDLDSIFAIQDEISHSIVDALKLKLLPQEKKALEHRGTTSAEAYDLYLLARQYWISGNDGDRRRDDIVLRLTKAAIELDPSYARAWALMALTQAWMHHRDKALEETGVAAAQKALELDPGLAEAHCALANDLAQQARFDEASAEIAEALTIDPESWDVNREAGFIAFRQGRMQEAMGYFQKAADLVETDCRSATMVMSCAQGLNDRAKCQAAAKETLARAEQLLVHDSANAAVLGYGASALAELGVRDRAIEWMRRALLLDPDNLILRSNLACAALRLDEPEEAISLIEPYLANCSALQLRHAEMDPDLDKLRQDGRFVNMLENARERLRRDAAPTPTAA